MTDILTIDAMTQFMAENLDSAPVKSGSEWSGVVSGIWHQSEIYEPSSPELGFHLFELCLNGHSRAKNRFDALIGDADAIYCPNALFYVPAGQTASVEMQGDVDVFQMWIEDRVFTSVKRQMFKGDPDRLEMRGFNGRFDPAMLNSVKSVVSETRRCGIGSAMLVDAATQQLAVSLLRFSASHQLKELRMGQLGRREVQAVLDLINDRLHENIGLEDLAKVTRMGGLEFSLAFEATFGQTPHDYLRDMRIERAIKLIETTKLPLETIAARCGFGMLANMIHQFMETEGVAPGRFRDAAGNEPGEGADA